MDPKTYYEIAKKIGAAFVEKFTLVNHQVSSYEYFIRHQLTDILEEISPIITPVHKQHVVHHIVIKNPWIAKPTIREFTDGLIRPLTPREAMQRRQTLLFDVYIDLEHKTYRSAGGNSEHTLATHFVYRNVLLFKCPSMVGSSTCHSHGQEAPAATFVINGYLKTLVSQEKLKTNYPFVFPPKTNSKFLFCAEVRSFHANKIRSTSTLYVHLNQDKNKTPVSVTVKVPFVKAVSDIGVFFVLLGVPDVATQVKLCLPHNASPELQRLTRTLLEVPLPAECKTNSVEDLLAYVGRDDDSTWKKKVQNAKNIFANEFLPHAESTKDKAFFLGLTVCKLLRTYLKEVPVDDKDSYVHKRIACAGSLISVLLCQLVKSWKKRLTIQIFKAETNSKPFKLTHFVNHRSISSGLKYAFSTGCWGIQRQNTNQSGVCQVVNSINIVSQLSHCRLLNIPLNRDGKSAVPRLLSDTAYGLTCAAETPEGKSVGLLNSLAFLATIRVGCPTKLILKILQHDNFVKSEDGEYLVLVNGIFAGYSAMPDPKLFLEKYKWYRRWQTFPVDSSICLDRQTIYIQSDEEAIVRPVINLAHMNKLEPLYKLYGHIPVVFWNRLICEGVVEFTTKEEEQNQLIALNLTDVTDKSTHMEVMEQFTIFGVAAGVSVLNDHNAGPRNIYSSGMVKQGIGSIPQFLNTKLDNKTFWLNYPQKNIVSSVVSDIIGDGSSNFGDSSSQCVVMAISSFGGHNQEDSVIIKREFLERGGFSTTMSRVQRDSEVSYGDDEEKFTDFRDQQLKVSARAKANYAKLDSDGLVLVGAGVTDTDVIIGKTIDFKSSQRSESSQQITTERVRRDRSVLLKGSEPGNVHSVAVCPSKDGNRSATVRVLSNRPVEVGDKFASRCGQKGVCGNIVSELDMFFTETDGITPDIIVNPHAIPSRMTISHLLEAVLGKLAAVSGKLADGTSFQDLDIHDLDEQCKKNKIFRMGKEYVINGKTGERMEKPVFIGVMTYMRLKHLVEDKIHARACGRKQILTRQPVEGRSREGGLRFGEMERDACVAYGASSVLIDRFMASSDLFETVLCKTCGRFAEPAKPADYNKLSIMHDKPYCRLCDSKENIVTFQMPYAFCLLYNELNALHIKLKFEIE